MVENSTEVTPLSRFWRLLAPDKKEITNIYIYAIFNGLVNLSLPLGIQAIINLLQGGRINASWIVLVSVVIAGVAITGVLQILQLKITEQLQRKIFTRAAFEFAFRIPRIKLEALYKKYAPELVNRFFDTITVQKSLSKILLDFSRATLQIIFGLLLLSFYHSFFILFSVFLIAFIYIIYRLTARRGLVTSLKESKYKYEVVHWLEEVARTNFVFRINEPVSLPLARTDALTTGYLDARQDHFKVLLQQYSMLIVFKAMVATGLLAIGGVLVMEQKMNIGQFVAAEIIILLIMNSVEKLIVSTETIYDALTALEKIAQVTDLPLILPDTEQASDILQSETVSLRFENIGFSYPGIAAPLFGGISLELVPGNCVVLESKNKEYANLFLGTLAGLYPPATGTIYLNGKPQKSLSQSVLRNRVGYLPADDQLFYGTISENITVGRSGLKNGAVEDITHELGILEDIEMLPAGFNTLIHPSDTGLHPALRQKIVLARALVHHPSLILLSNPFRYLNQDETERLTNYLLVNNTDKTVVVYTQNKDFVQQAASIIRLDSSMFTTPD